MKKVVYTDSSIYCRGNPYGFKYNVNHPLIGHLYGQYKRNHDLPEHYPISDPERRHFEDAVSRLINAGKIIVR